MVVLGSSAIGAGGVIFAVFVLLALATLSLRIGAHIAQRARAPRPVYAYVRRARRNRRTMPPRRYW